MNNLPLLFTALASTSPVAPHYPSASLSSDKKKGAETGRGLLQMLDNDG